MSDRTTGKVLDKCDFSILSLDAWAIDGGQHRWGLSTLTKFPFDTRPSPLFPDVYPSDGTFFFLSRPEWILSSEKE